MAYYQPAYDQIGQLLAQLTAELDIDGDYYDAQAIINPGQGVDAQVLQALLRVRAILNLINNQGCNDPCRKPVSKCDIIRAQRRIIVILLRLLSLLRSGVSRLGTAYLAVLTAQGVLPAGFAPTDANAQVITGVIPSGSIFNQTLASPATYALASTPITTYGTVPTTPSIGAQLVIYNSALGAPAPVVIYNLPAGSAVVSGSTLTTSASGTFLASIPLYFTAGAGTPAGTYSLNTGMTARVIAYY